MLDRLLCYTVDPVIGCQFGVEVISDIILNLKKGKAMRCDNLSAEHLQFCHPTIIVIIFKFFNMMILLGYVPDAFGRGIIIPIPKSNDGKNWNKVEEFRGITVSPILSKVFESCLVRIIGSYFNSSERQFGFKKGVGCRDAIFTVKSVVDHYTRNNSTINICALDLTKAFDRVNHDILFLKLMERKVPKSYVLILKNWYDKIFISVRWGDSLSPWTSLLSGVRQGGILSPVLFAIFVDSVLDRLAKCGLGCFIKSFCVNSFMYADDLILLSISLYHMQKLVDICFHEFGHLGLQINIKKSACIRVGSNFRNTDLCIFVNGVPLAWQQEIKYLGISFIAGRKLSCSNTQCIRHKFFRAVNGVFGKIGLKSSPAVTCSLITSYCIPILLYALEAVTLNKNSRLKLEAAYSQVFSKIFNTYDQGIIRQCQCFMSCLPIKYLLDINKINFLQKFYFSSSYTAFLFKNEIRVEAKEICDIYNVNFTAILNNWIKFKTIVWRDFNNSCQI